MKSDYIKLYQNKWKKYKQKDMGHSKVQATLHFKQTDPFLMYGNRQQGRRKHKSRPCSNQI